AGFTSVISRQKADRSEWRRRLAVPSQHRISDIFGALDAGVLIDEIHELSYIDPWFLDQLLELWQETRSLSSAASSLGELKADSLARLKRLGFSDLQLAKSLSAANPAAKPITEDDVFNHRHALNVRPAFKTIDTCGAEFQAFTPYMYSTYEKDSEV